MIAIHGDNHVEAGWFQNLSPDLRTAHIEILGPRGTNAPAIDDLLTYDRPDIILTLDGVPKLILEKTREVPTGHNVGQRMARLVRAVESGLPTLKFFPFDAKKHGAYASICHLNIRVLRALERMSEIHDVPALAINWPADRNGELVIGGPENVEVRHLVQTFLDAGMPRSWPAARAVQERMRQEYQDRLVARPAYGEYPPSVVPLETSRFIRETRAAVGSMAALDALQNRAHTLVYTMDMSPAACRREDPYTGMQFIYDYSSCRSGPDAEDKVQNLVLRFPRVSRERWADANPDDPDRKSSNWYLTANAMVFSDGAALLRVSR